MEVGGVGMLVIAERGSIRIRRMEDSDSDLRLYLKWMTDPETMRFWEGMTEHYTYDRVLEEYRAHAEECVTPCIIEYADTPIGYCQFYPIPHARYYEAPEALYVRFVNASDAAFGIDAFLGEAEYRDRGIGTDAMRLLMRALFTECGADVILIDPKVHNARAIRCYHKCGLRDYFVVPERELQDGVWHDCLIMGVRKADFL